MSGDETDFPDEMEVVEYPIDGILDLHLFRPEEARELVQDYLDLCLEKGITEVRIIHGKGKGVLRRLVHDILDKHPHVVHYGHDSLAGSWGATVVTLTGPKELSSSTD